METKEKVTEVEERHPDEKPLAYASEMSASPGLPDSPNSVIPAQEEAPPPPPQKSCCNSNAGGGNGGNGEIGFIYAIGTIEARFPSLSVEKEFVQTVKEARTANLTDQQVLYEVLSQEENQYLAREMCFVFTVENIDTYILQPASQLEMKQLIEALKPSKGIDCDVVIGTRGPIAPPNMCNGLQVPIVFCERIYSFEVEDFIKAIPEPPDMDKKAFRNAAKELFYKIMQLADNVGEMDEHRAVNYLALRYPVIYSLALEMFAADKSLSMVEVQPSRLAGTRKVVNVIFSYVNRSTDVMEKYFTRVDVTDKFPFLVSKLQPFYDR
jgi:hypothetical protein